MKRELKKILYAEDEPDIRSITTIALESFGNFVLKTCHSGKQALEEISDFDPDLILSDVMMPEMDGPTLLKKVRENPKYSNLPVVFLTAKSQSDDLERYIHLGASKVILKPFNPVTLPDELKEAWESCNA